MLMFTCLKIRSCIEYQIKECKNFKNFKFSRKLPPKLIPFIVLNKILHAHGKSDDNQYAWHETSVKRKRDIGEKKNLAGICNGCILIFLFGVVLRLNFFF